MNHRAVFATTALTVAGALAATVAFTAAANGT